MPKNSLKWQLGISIIMSFTCIAGLFSQSGNVSRNEKILKDKIAYWTYRDYDSVVKYYNVLIRIKSDKKQVLEELNLVSEVFSCACYFFRIPESVIYLQYGEKLIRENRMFFESKDTIGDYIATQNFNYALYDYLLGNYSRSIARLLVIPESSSNNEQIAASLKFAGQAYFNIGNYDKAIHYFRLADEYVINPDFKQQALSLLYESEYSFAIGKTTQALGLLKKALALLNREDPNSARNSVNSALRLISKYYLKNNQYDSAMLYTRMGLKYKSKQDPGLMYTYNSLADIFYSLQQPDSAIKYYSLSYKYTRMAFKELHPEKSKSLLGMANVYTDLGDFNKAQDYYNQGMANLQPASVINANDALMPVETMRLLVGEARMYIKWYKSENLKFCIDSAVSCLQKALAINDASRRELVNPETKESKTELQFQITRLGLEASVLKQEKAVNKQELLFMFSEKSKANILHDQADISKAAKFAGIPDSLLTRESLIKGELAYYREVLMKLNPDDSKYKIISIAYNKKLEQYLLLIDTFEKNYPRYYQLKYKSDVCRIHDLQKEITRRSLLIEYAFTDDKIIIQGISKNKVFVHTAENNEIFNSHLNRLMGQLNDADIGEKENDPVRLKNFTESAYFLYSRLLEPILDECSASINQLIIIPEGKLCYLPFEVLITSNQPVSDFRNIPFLVNNYAVSYEFSATLWNDNTNNGHNNKNTFIGFAPGRFAMGESLAASGDEVIECSRIWKGIFFTGQEATEANFRSHITPGSILELATHTFINDDDPQQSYFRFSAGKDRTDDGILYNHELYSMNIPARLAILSSCETGSGNFSQGEGIISLARAFKYAGCPNIIMSLWKVNDLSTSKIMILFNRNLKRGMPVDLALQRAKLSYLKNSENLHPAYWGSFVLIGNSSPVKSNLNAYVFAVLAIFVLFDFFFILKYRRKKI